VPADTTIDILGLFPPGSAVDPDGELVVGGCRLADLAARWGTPMYVVDEQAVRSQVRRYQQALGAAWPHSRMVWASKAFPCTAVYRLMAAEGIGVDIAGAGEGLGRGATDADASACDENCLAHSMTSPELGPIVCPTNRLA